MTPKTKGSYFGPKHSEQTTLSYTHFIDNAQAKPRQHYFPSQALPEPEPILTEDGLQEHRIESILDSKHQGHGWKYLIRWTGYGSEHDEWLSGKFLKDNEALNVWLESSGNGPVNR